MHAEIPIGMIRLAVVASLLACACSERGANSDVRSVVWIEVDTLRADALGCYGNEARGEGGALPSPVIDGLAAEGVLFERAYGAAPWTVPSLVTQLTGLWPWQHGAVRLLEPIEVAGPNLPERFRREGWRTACVMTNYVAQDQYHFDSGFEIWDQELAKDGPEGSTGVVAAESLLEITDHFLERPGEGLFLLLFLFEPHWRYEAQPGLSFGLESSGGLTLDGSLADLRKRRADLTPEQIDYLRGVYQSEVAGVDRAIGVFLDGLHERGLDEEALIVFTSDHGEELMERGWIGHTRTLHEELVRVPLVMRLPTSMRASRASTRVPFAVSQIDLGATILDLMEVEETLGEGVSLASTVLDGARPARRYLFLHTDFDPPLRTPESLEKVAIQWGVVDAESNEKWIVDRHPEHEVDGKPPTLWFRLNEDPLEQNDLSSDGAAPQELFALPALNPEVSTELLNGEYPPTGPSDE